ncbi:hypothetical protein Back2_01900 [Nocardioides baekrokdamisoli]|uniref:SURF1-like protein n=1 Tax=Nocardioides baekrokdamisoli TaxID=1804624 RepID=A0A3G9IUM5_9ACTN|nr:SURF1 family protein [Nocardioides baekrokdamisoli]BBH15903.1 hypothetical protein Back2_01900 [Nocardioides baekrokdamisoli]
MRSFRFLLSRRWALFAVAVALSAYACWLLGQWQFGRLHTRQANNAIVRINEHAPTASVAEVMKPITSTSTGPTVSNSNQWRHVTATGTYDTSHMIIWRYLTNDRSQSGVDMVVPLMTATGIVLVNRGWVGSEDSINLPTPAPVVPSGVVTVTGWLQQDGTGPSTAVNQVNGGANTRAISSTAVQAAMGKDWPVPVYGGWVALQSEKTAADNAPHAAPGMTPADYPTLDDGPHFFYGLQWYFFGILALFGFGYLAYEERRTEIDPEFAATMDARRRAHLERNAKKKAVKDAYKKAYADAGEK